MNKKIIAMLAVCLVFLFAVTAVSAEDSITDTKIAGDNESIATFNNRN